MSTYELPIVGGIVDEVVSFAENNPLYNILPKFIRVPLMLAVELVLDAAAYFAVALTLGGGLFYMWPSIVALAPRHLSAPGGGYWTYVVLALALVFAYVLHDTVKTGKEAKADVLHKDTRSKALETLSVPAMLIMLVWLITTYIA